MMTSKVTDVGTDLDEDDFEFHSCESDMENESTELTFDALTSTLPSKSHKDITINNLIYIDQHLELYEKVSLVYLLYDDPQFALENIISILENRKLCIATEWYNETKLHGNKLIEALSIIQNYEILRNIGYPKDEIIIRYTPLQDATIGINSVRKYCYRVCEDLKCVERMKFLELVKKTSKCKMPNKVEFYHWEYLEVYFLFLENENFISLREVSNLVKVFKEMDLLNLSDKFQTLQERLPPKDKNLSSLRKQESANYYVDRMPNGLSPSNSNDLVTFNDKNENNTHSAYMLDPEYPGLLLIVNNEAFHTEYKSKYVDKLPKTNLKLENRTGSQVDKDRLGRVFKNLNFEVITKDNLVHNNIIKEIQNAVDIVEKKGYSTLVVAILSHGDQGVVYGANSIPVEILKIQRGICSPKLSGKPKVLLLQCCQGNECQKLYDDDSDDIEVDGPEKVYPKTTDLLVFRATIAGYGAVRNRKEGTWFIQEFCNAVEKHSHEEIQVICREVIGKVSNKSWNSQYMVPETQTTFTKQFYLKSSGSSKN